MCQLLVEHVAGRISGERRPALRDCSIDDLKIPLDYRHRRRVELGPSLAHDVLEHVDLSSVYEVGMRAVSCGLARETGGYAALTRGSVDLGDARCRTVTLSARDTNTVSYTHLTLPTNR